MGFFDGISSLWSSPPSTTPVKPFLPFNHQFVGHVLDVILDKDHPQYDESSNRVVGTVFWRDVFDNYGMGLNKFQEAEFKKTANPLDRSNVKIPVPGEQVLIYKAKSSRLDGPDVFLTSKYYYTSVVHMTTNPTYNSAPFIGVDPDLLNPFLPGARTVGELARRFDKKTKNLAAFKEGEKPIVHKQLQLNEGDFILQGRFGGSIRFAGTPVENQVRGQQWAEGKKGLAGDPIMLMRINNNRGKFDDLESTAYETEDINTDAASMYMTTTQQIPVKLAIPDKGKKAHPLASWAYSIGIEFAEPDIEKTAGKAKDGEKARSGPDKTSPKEAGSSTDFKPEDSTPPQPVPGDVTNIQNDQNAVDTEADNT